jgi:hypothetical protein
VRAKSPNFEFNLDNSIHKVIRSGNYKFAKDLIKSAIKRGGFGFGEFHELALSSKKVTDIGHIKKINCQKKSINNR